MCVLLSGEVQLGGRRLHFDGFFQNGFDFFAGEEVGGFECADRGAESFGHLLVGHFIVVTE